MIREILHFPDPRLKQPGSAVKNITGDLVQLVDDMVLTMYDAPGVGLAAVQVGVPQRIVVIDVDHEEPSKHLLKLINPVITAREGEIIWEEGCLSVIDYTAEVKRAAKVEVKAWTPDEKELTLQAEDLLAVALQHEIDHLDGKLFIDRISRLKRELYSRRVKKLLREGRPLEARKGPPAI
ncbi:MAG TPA: peptide deformylase [Candidatus Binatia bacterium]|nr:peptide deformylase [Candidatus Binatia bacterium]